MCATSFMCLHPTTWISLFPWKLAKNLKFRDTKKICGSIWMRPSGGLAAKSQCFMAKWGLKVRISIFPWQPVWILKFWHSELPLWPRQIVRARFRYDRSRSCEVVSGLKKRPRLPACVFSHFHGEIHIGDPNIPTVYLESQEEGNLQPKEISFSVIAGIIQWI